MGSFRTIVTEPPAPLADKPELCAWRNHAQICGQPEDHAWHQRRGYILGNLTGHSFQPPEKESSEAAPADAERAAFRAAYLKDCFHPTNSETIGHAGTIGRLECAFQRGIAYERERMTDPALVEVLAALAHEMWSGWMRYMTSRLVFAADADNEPRLMTVADRARWIRQMTTRYESLPEHEKESDRDEARRMLAAIAGHEVKP